MGKKRKDPKKSWYWVSSGDLEWLGKAESEEEALNLAFDTQKGAALGVLTAVHALQHDVSYYDTKQQLERRDFTVKMK